MKDEYGERGFRGLPLEVFVKQFLMPATEHEPDITIEEWLGRADVRDRLRRAGVHVNGFDDGRARDDH